MKRVTKFEVCICDNSQLNPEMPYRSLGERSHFESWHKTCDFILNQIAPLHEQPEGRIATDLQALAFEARSHSLIAHFCNSNLEAANDSSTVQESSELDDEEDEGGSSRVSKRWDSVVFAYMAGCNLFENRNVSDYYWELLEGARREVPFRLQYLEKQAESNLLVAHGLSFIQLFKEALRLPG